LSVRQQRICDSSRSLFIEPVESFEFIGHPQARPICFMSSRAPDGISAVWEKGGSKRDF
jgi:hypothetical protein